MVTCFFTRIGCKQSLINLPEEKKNSVWPLKINYIKVKHDNHHHHVFSMIKKKKKKHNNKNRWCDFNFFFVKKRNYFDCYLTPTPCTNITHKNSSYARKTNKHKGAKNRVTYVECVSMFFVNFFLLY